jgi:hypothetical protein
MGVSGQRHAPAALYPRGKNPRYPFDRKLGLLSDITSTFCTIVMIVTVNICGQYSHTIHNLVCDLYTKFHMSRLQWFIKRKKDNIKSDLFLI